MSNFREENVLAKTPKILLDRLEIEGVVAVIADITSVSSRVFQYASRADAIDDLNGTEIGSAQTTLAASCMRNSLQKDGMWGTRDGTGWNCRINLPASYFPDGGFWYRVEQSVQPSSSGAEPFWLTPWILQSQASAVD